METRLVKLKSDFNNIINIRNTVKNIFDILQVRTDRLRQIYSEFIQTNKTELFVFGLDSFHFQSKLIDIEYQDMKRLFLAINNRMYCEYFKLHKIIVEYIAKNVKDSKSDLIKINAYPTYRDLEPFKEYKFEVILDIHENILNLLGVLISILNNKENELSIHKTKQNIGLNIDNFITSFNFNISVMREKIIMFITYVEFFHKMHSKYLKRFSNKIQLMYTHITNDIKFDDSVEISKHKKRELIDDFNANNIDKELLKELKTSIGSETNSETSGDEQNTPNKHFGKKMNTEKKAEKVEKVEKVEKKDYKKIFQRSVNKVNNLINFIHPNPVNVVADHDGFSDDKIDELFSGIEETCDSIIYEHPTPTSHLSVMSEFDHDDIFDYSSDELTCTLDECVSHNNKDEIASQFVNMTNAPVSDINVVSSHESHKQKETKEDTQIKRRTKA